MRKMCPRCKCIKAAALLLALMLVVVASLPLIALAKTYQNNTACAQGIYLRRLKNPVTDKWYMVSPLDLSQEGSQELPLIAGNFMVIGLVAALVEDGRLTLTAHYVDGVEAHSECLMLYADLADIDEVEPDRMVTPYRFGEPVDLAKLGTDQVWLYVNNRVSFTDGLPSLATYFSQGLPQIGERIALAQSAGLGDAYLEKLPLAQSPQQTPGPGVPDENGCIDGVCPMPTIKLPDNLPTLPIAP